MSQKQRSGGSNQQCGAGLVIPGFSLGLANALRRPFSKCSILVTEAPADGHTLLMGVGPLATAPALFRNVPFDVQRDFAPVITRNSLPGLQAVTVIIYAI